MFHAQAALSTVLFITMVCAIYIGLLCAMYHKVFAVRAFGFFLIAAGIVGFVSHSAALIVGG